MTRRGRPKRDYAAEEKAALKALAEWLEDHQNDDEFDVEDYFTELQTTRMHGGKRRTSEDPE